MRPDFSDTGQPYNDVDKFPCLQFCSRRHAQCFSVRKNLDFRLEGYLFKPLAAITEGVNQTPKLDEEITKIYFAATAGLVMHSTIGPISLSVNYYDDPKPNWVCSFISDFCYSTKHRWSKSLSLLLVLGEKPLNTSLFQIFPLSLNPESEHRNSHEETPPNASGHHAV